MDQERDRRGGREDEKKKRNDADACERRDKARRAEIILRTAQPDTEQPGRNQKSNRRAMNGMTGSRSGEAGSGMNALEFTDGMGATTMCAS